MGLPIFLGVGVGWITEPQPSEVWLGLTTVLAGMAIALLSRCMGWVASVSFAALSMAIALLSEAIAMGQFDLLAHALTPQLWGVPIPILSGWFVALAAAYGLSAALVEAWAKEEQQWLWRLGLTPVVATVYDLTVDPKGLAQGLWEWHVPGDYATQILGKNGVAGIPWLNFVSWILITAAVTVLFDGLCRLRGWSPQFNLGWAASFYVALCSSGLVWLGLQRLWPLLFCPLLPLLLLLVWIFSATWQGHHSPSDV